MDDYIKTLADSLLASDGYLTLKQLDNILEEVSKSNLPYVSKKAYAEKIHNKINSSKFTEFTVEDVTNLIGKIISIKHQKSKGI